jgi:hypothetical protein
MRCVLYNAAQQLRHAVFERFYIGQIGTKPESILICLVCDSVTNFIKIRAALPQEAHSDRHTHKNHAFISRTPHGRPSEATSGWTRQAIPRIFWNQGSLPCPAACQWSLTYITSVMCTFYFTDQVEGAVNAINLHSEEARLDSWPGHWLCWDLSLFVFQSLSPTEDIRTNSFQTLYIDGTGLQPGILRES